MRVAALLAFELCGAILVAQTAASPPRIAAAGEPGQQIVISGVVFSKDGRTPLAGARLFLYQTDQRGIYADGRGEPRNVARLRAFITADSRGRYSFGTIKPGRYPNRTQAAHIHVHVAPPGTSEADLLDYRWSVGEYVFEGDEFIPTRVLDAAKNQGRFSSVMHLARREDGVWYGERDLRLGDHEG